jgi:outer membrane receptor protein involved in Fe transport
MHGVSASALVLFASAAQAQNAGATNSTVEQVVVTGTHIVENGNQMPTPVTVLTSDLMQKMAPLSVPDSLEKLPTLASSQSTNSPPGAFNGAGSALPGNFLNLDGLGSNRVLILQNGHRVPATNSNNTVDNNTLPQQFVQRVDVVTGGASAVYGSDAVAGVVNYILDRHYNGLKGQLQGGISMYGDGKSFRAAIAGGTDLFGGRGHIEASSDFTNRDEIRNSWTRPFGGLSLLRVGAGNAANPFTGALGARQNTVTYGGLVANGPAGLNGQMFLPDGTLAPFNIGKVTGTSSISIGGDGATEGPEDLTPSYLSHQEYARFDYELSPSTHFYVDTGFGQVRSNIMNQNLFHAGTTLPIPIYSGNAYLKPAYQAVINAQSSASVLAGTAPAFQLNRYDQDIGGVIDYTVHVSNFTVSTGVNGTLFDDFNWEAYYTHGEGRTMNTSHKNINMMRFYAAADAIVAPAGNALNIPAGKIICRATLVTPGLFPGCQPLDLFGNEAPSTDARNYIWQDTSYTVNNKMDDFAANITGPISQGWAGPIKGAVGVEYRLQSMIQTAFTPVGGDVFDPTGLRPAVTPNANTAPSGFPNGTFAYAQAVNTPGGGTNSVYEGNVELSVPLVKDLPLAESIVLDSAYRYTNYSTSGSANTWKIGIDWQVIDDVRIRATRSRDIRAPTLNDLYQGVSNLILGFTDSSGNGIGSGQSGFTSLQSQGNPNLKPEVARNTTAGIVYTPSWLSNFSLSADFFRTYIGNAIGAVSGNNASALNQCIASSGTSPLCALYVRATPTSFPSQLLSYNANQALFYTEGYDFEANYAFDLSDLVSSWPGTITQRLLFTRIPITTTQSLPGTVVTKTAGVKDRATYNFNYDLDGFDANFLVRYQGPSVATTNNTQIFTYHGFPAYYQVDTNLSYDFTWDETRMTAFLNINNLFDATGVYVPGPGGLAGFFYPAQAGADTIGRYYTVGLRFKM